MKKILLLAFFLGALMITVEAQYNRAPSVRAKRSKVKSGCKKKNRIYKRHGVSGVVRTKKSDANKRRKKARRHSRRS